MNPAAAANVGLRRAEGRFVSPKASDTYLSNEIIATIARQDLHENALYRCDRCDVTLSPTLLRNLGDDALLARLESLDSTRYSHIPQPAAMVHPRTAHQRLRRLPADEPHHVADRPRLSPGRHGAVARLRFADHARRRGAGIARDPPAGGLSRLQGPPRPPVQQPHQPRLDAAAVEGRQGHDQFPLVAAPADRAQRLRLSQAQGRRRGKRAGAVDRAQFRQARRAMGARHPPAAQPAGKLGPGAISRSRKGCCAGRGGR